MTNHEPLGKYRILSELGKGGFATVYRAVDTTLDREVALKVLDPLLLRDGAWVARFRQEAKAVANLRHPHIINIHEVGEVEGRLYIAMELARGGNLADVIAARQRLPWAEMLDLLQPVCAALDYAHGQGVIHRDLKPANILLDPESGPLLTDFGFARLLRDNTMTLSLSGGILGTPAYIAPEIWDQNQAEQPADIYALGCIVCEMLTGEPLFKGRTPMQTMRTHDQGPQYPETWPDDVPVGIITVLDNALARAPDQRYPDATTLWNALCDLNTQTQAARVEQLPQDHQPDTLPPPNAAPVEIAATSSQPVQAQTPRQSTPTSSPTATRQSKAPVLGVIGTLLALVSCLGSFLICPSVLTIPAFILGILALGQAKNSANPKSAQIWGILAIALACLALTISCLAVVVGL